MSVFEEFTVSIQPPPNTKDMRRRTYSNKMACEDMDYNSMEPLFFGMEDIQEDFYDDNLGKDLFKKFELSLLPTPPRSPKHEPFPSDTGDQVERNLQRVSKVLLDENDPISRTMVDCTCFNASNLIQDCMWSAPGLLAAGLLSPADIKKAGGKSLSPPSSPEAETNSCHKKEECSQKISSKVDINSNECVDPAAVFPYPVSCEPKPLSHRPSQVSLGSVAETPSPSESDDDEEDEEEIDVVTVDKSGGQRHRRVAPPSSAAAAAAAAASRRFSAHVATMHNYSNTTGNPAPPSYSAPQSPSALSNHHCHKRSRPLSMPGSPQPPSKRPRSIIHSTDLGKVVQKLNQRSINHHGSHLHHQHISHSASTSQSPSSDSEDSCDGSKRAQHNVLERKRRNDLKYSFQRLKDTVPELSRQDRAAKVVILRKSADYIRSLGGKHGSLVKEEEKQRRIHEHLLKKLNQLRRECY